MYCSIWPSENCQVRLTEEKLDLKGRGKQSMFYGWEKREFRSAGLPPAAAVDQELFAHRIAVLTQEAKENFRKQCCGTAPQEAIVRRPLTLPFEASLQLARQVDTISRFLDHGPRDYEFEPPHGLPRLPKFPIYPMEENFWPQLELLTQRDLSSFSCIRLPLAQPLPPTYLSNDVCHVILDGDSREREREGYFDYSREDESPHRVRSQFLCECCFWRQFSQNALSQSSISPRQEVNECADGISGGLYNVYSQTLYCQLYYPLKGSAI